MSKPIHMIHWVQYDAEGQNPKRKTESRSSASGAAKFVAKLEASGTAGNIEVRQMGNRIVL